jgi:hypothetical protein
LGFVSEVVQGGRKEVLGKALDMAGVIAIKSPVAVVSTKHLLNREQQLASGRERGAEVDEYANTTDARDHS